MPSTPPTPRLSERVGPLPWWIYGAVLLLDLVLLAVLVSLFWVMVDVAEDWLWLW